MCALLFATVVPGAMACGASGEEIRAKQLAQKDEPTPVEILYAAILDEMAARQTPIATASERMWMVIGEFEPRGAELRRRLVSQVRVFPNGVALTVLAEYQRMDRTQSPPIWVEATEDSVQSQARRDEADFGAAVQARFSKTR